MSSGSISIATLSEGQTVAVAGVLIAQVEGRYFAVDNRCPHAGAELTRARLDGFELTCPRHGARFDIRSGAELSASGCGALTLRSVTADRGRLQVK